MNLLSTIRSTFKPKSALQLAVAELEEAERSRLRHLSAREYANGIVIYHDAQISRLRQFIAESQIKPE